MKGYPASKYRISFANIAEIADIVSAISIFLAEQRTVSRLAILLNIIELEKVTKIFGNRIAVNELKGTDNILW